jgi:triosephosphate isomerase
MNTTVDEARELAKSMRSGLEAVGSVERVLCPPFVSLYAVRWELRDSPVSVGAQDLFWEEKGAYTGEVSPTMLKPLCEYAIIGHSERRQYFGETNETVNRKVKAALKVGLKPIVCVGENLGQREAGETNAFIAQQVREGLAGLPSLENVVVAYEPIWAIGTGRAATSAMAQETIAVIRGVLAEVFDGEQAEATRIQYGGSVTAANAEELFGQPDIDGGLVGGASLKADDFVRIVQAAARK